MSRNLSPSEIRYTQKSIANKFKKGTPLEDVICGMVSGNISVHNFPIIRVVHRDNKWWSLDNRRLYVFKEVQRRKPNFYSIPVIEEQVDAREWSKKFTTRNEGTSIQIRGRAVVITPHSFKRGGRELTWDYGGDEFQCRAVTQMYMGGGGRTTTDSGGDEYECDGAVGVTLQMYMEGGMSYGGEDYDSEDEYDDADLRF